MEKKPYTAPVVTEQGDAVKHTKGINGGSWEYRGHRADILIDDGED